MIGTIQSFQAEQRRAVWRQPVSRDENSGL
jgi:hypothetical protein